MILNGKNLGERHRDLNSKISEAIAKQKNFEDLNYQPENYDIDKLFNIDLASKYKNIGYILEVLKCGDVFYISRALKCIWMYQDEYSQFINKNYLETKIFPHMSRKMQKKVLTSISMHVRTTDRVEEFYKYCVDTKLKDYAPKFLVYTSESFKLDLLKSRSYIEYHKSKFLKYFIGNSFELALAYLDVHDYSSYIIQELHFLYSVSENKYLKILELIRNEARYPYCSSRLGIRISKSILKKHKQRVLDNPVLYVNILHTGMLVKHLTTDEIELLAPRLLPKHSTDYWSLNFYETYKFILQKIPTNELYIFMKQIFISKYKRSEFKMSIEFYKLKYYEMLNISEREAWALQHIKRDKELPGIKNYMWYKFVSFPKAFSGIKRYIFVTPDKDERSQIVNILPETARNQKDLKKILNYYYGRHINESDSHRESFVNKIIEVHDIYSFNNECWITFDKLLYSLNVYLLESYGRVKFIFISMVYHILHEKDMPKAMEKYLEDVVDFYHLGCLIVELTEENKTIVAEYWLTHYRKQIESLMRHPDYDIVRNDGQSWESETIKDQIGKLVWKVWSIIYTFNRSDEDCPAVVIRFMESNMDIYQHHNKYRTMFAKKTEEDFMRWLKQDMKMAVDGISEIRCNAYRWNFRLCRLFRKLKVYFPNDVAKEYLKYFMAYLSNVPESGREYRNIKIAVVGLFYLGDPESIISFLDKHVPISPKIDHMNIDNRVLQVQKAICRLAYHPRPPLPLSVIQKYITGDYIHYCLPTIYNYFTTLPSSAKFIDSLLDAPLSIQKHGLRLAFRSYNEESLSPIIKSAWKKTRNVSLRMLLYETLFNRILEERHEVQEKLFEVLKLYTSELIHDDHDNVYSLLVSDNFPAALQGDFIETAWLTVSKLSDKSVDIQRRISVVRHMERYIHLIQRNFARIQIIDGHVKDMLFEKNISRDHGESYIQDLINAKWQLTAKYIVSFNDEVEKQQSLQLMQTIMNESIQSWNVVKGKIYIVRKFMNEFVETLMDKDPKTIESCVNISPIYQFILDSLTSSLSKEEIYLLHWKLKLSLTCRNIIFNGIKTESDSESEKCTNIAIKDIGNSYGKAVAKMVVRCVKNDNFYRCYYKSIAEIVNNVGCTICDILDIDNCGFVYFVCESLIKTKMTETHLLALFMLPRDPYSEWDREHIHIIIDIKEQAVSQEVWSFLYDKYVLSDYKFRHCNRVDCNYKNFLL